MTSITGIRTHRSSWYPSSGWTTTISDISISLQAGPTKNVDTSSTKHRLMTCLKIKTTSDSSIKYISKITITANGYRSSNTSGNLIARICSADPSANSTAGDSEAAMEALSISGVSQATASAEATAKDMTFSFVGTFNPNQEYYIIFYTAQASVMYLFTKNINSFSVTDVSVQKKTYTITYNANGGSGTTSSQTALEGDSINLRANNFTVPSQPVHGINLELDGGTGGAATFINNAFYQWRTGATSGNYYAANASYTPKENTTFYAAWSTNYRLGTPTKQEAEKDGYVVKYNANGGICPITQTIVKDTVTYSFAGWKASSNTYPGETLLGGPATYTYVAQWNSNVLQGTINSFPEATNQISSVDLTITYDYQGGSGSVNSSVTRKTVGKNLKGWGTSASSTTVLSLPYKPNSDNETLYAIWGTEKITYTSINLPTPTKAGHSFLGWASSPTASSGTIGTYTPNSDIKTLYAIWGPEGNVRLYKDSSTKYSMALVYIYAPTNSSDASPWKLLIPYAYTSGTQPWKIIAG